MRIDGLRLLYIKIIDDGKIIYEGMCEDAPEEYKNKEIKKINNCNPMEIELL